MCKNYFVGGMLSGRNYGFYLVCRGGYRHFQNGRPFWNVFSLIYVHDTIIL